MSRSLVEHQREPVVGIDGLADAVADAVGVDGDELAVGSVLKDVGAVELAGVGVGVVGVGGGAYGDEEVLVILGEDNVAGPVAAAAKLGVAGDVGDDGLGLAGGLEVSGFVGEALDGGRVADVDVLRVGAGGVEGDAEGVVEAGGEFFDGGRPAAGGDAAEDEDGAGTGVGDEKIAVGSGGDVARLGEGAVGELHVLGGVGALQRLGVAAGVEGDTKAGGGDGPGVDGAGERGWDRYRPLRRDWGLGGSPTVILWRTPGCCWFQSVKAAWPVRSGGGGRVEGVIFWARAEEVKRARARREDLGVMGSPWRAVGQ